MAGCCATLGISVSGSVFRLHFLTLLTYNTQSGEDCEYCFALNSNDLILLTAASSCCLYLEWFLSFVKTLMLTIYYHVYTSEHKHNKSNELSEIWRTARPDAGPNCLFSSSSNGDVEHLFASSSGGRTLFPLFRRFSSLSSKQREEIPFQGKNEVSSVCTKCSSTTIAVQE